MFRLGPLLFVVVSVALIAAGNTLARVVGATILVVWLAPLGRWISRRRA